ncbi:hypothetical protein Celaphus_00017939, partial [Cervus elaphus hippelaphus]
MKPKSTEGNFDFLFLLYVSENDQTLGLSSKYLLLTYAWMTSDQPSHYEKPANYASLKIPKAQDLKETGGVDLKMVRLPTNIISQVEAVAVIVMVVAHIEATKQWTRRPSTFPGMEGRQGNGHTCRRPETRNMLVRKKLCTSKEAPFPITFDISLKIALKSIPHPTTASLPVGAEAERTRELASQSQSLPLYDSESWNHTHQALLRPVRLLTKAHTCSKDRPNDVNCIEGQVETATPFHTHDIPSRKSKRSKTCLNTFDFGMT